MKKGKGCVDALRGIGKKLAKMPVPGFGRNTFGRKKGAIQREEKKRVVNPG